MAYFIGLISRLANRRCIRIKHDGIKYSDLKFRDIKAKIENWHNFVVRLDVVVPGHSLALGATAVGSMHHL